MKIRTVGTKKFCRKDRRTDMTKLTTTLPNFVNVPENYAFCP